MCYINTKKNNWVLPNFTENVKYLKVWVLRYLYLKTFEKKWLNNYFLLGWRNKFSFNLKKKITFGRQPPGTVSLGKRLFEKVQVTEKRNYNGICSTTFILTGGGLFILWNSFKITDLNNLLLRMFSCLAYKDIIMYLWLTITRKCSLWDICCFSSYHSWL